MKTIATKKEKKQSFVEVAYNVLQEKHLYSTRLTYYVEIEWNNSIVLTSRPISKKLVDLINEKQDVNFTIFQLWLNNKIKEDEKKIYKIISKYLGKLETTFTNL